MIEYFLSVDPSINNAGLVAAKVEGVTNPKILKVITRTVRTKGKDSTEVKMMRIVDALKSISQMSIDTFGRGVFDYIIIEAPDSWYRKSQYGKPTNIYSLSMLNLATGVIAGHAVNYAKPPPCIQLVYVSDWKRKKGKRRTLVNACLEHGYKPESFTEHEGDAFAMLAWWLRARSVNPTTLTYLQVSDERMRRNKEV